MLIYASRPHTRPTASSRPRNTPTSSRRRLVSSPLPLLASACCFRYFARSSSCYTSRRRASLTSFFSVSTSASAERSSSTRCFSDSTFSAVFVSTSFSPCRIAISFLSRTTSSSFSVWIFYASPPAPTATLNRRCSSSLFVFKNATSAA